MSVIQNRYAGRQMRDQVSKVNVINIMRLHEFGELFLKSKLKMEEKETLNFTFDIDSSMFRDYGY